MASTRTAPSPPIPAAGTLVTLPRDMESGSVPIVVRQEITAP
jgi:hypothetical protein